MTLLVVILVVGKANLAQVMGYRYDAYGNLFTQMAAPYNAVGFTGQTYDAKASLMDYSARWYSPTDGRFTTPDTYAGNVIDPTSLNRYIYALDNPVNVVDPTGHLPCMLGDNGNCYFPGQGDGGSTGGSGGGSGNTGGTGGATGSTGDTGTGSTGGTGTTDNTGGTGTGSTGTGGTGIGSGIGGLSGGGGTGSGGTQGTPLEQRRTNFDLVASVAPLSSQYDPMNSVFKMKFGNIVPDTSGDYYGWALASLTAVSFLLDGILVVTIGAATVFSRIAMVETQDTTAVQEVATSAGTTATQETSAAVGADTSAGASIAKGTGEIPATKSVANEVANRLDGQVEQLKGNSWKVTVENGNKPIVIRIMQEGSGGRPNPYFRVSVDGKGSYTLEGQLSNNKGVTHVTSLQNRSSR